MIAPRLTDTSPSSVRGNRPYPITGKVEMPKPASKGTIVLERRDGRRWTRVGAQRPTRFRRYGSACASRRA